MRELSRICCMDCGRDTGARGLKEYPTMLRDAVWLSITTETDGVGVLCRADMERRLGRPLTEADMAMDNFERGPMTPSWAAFWGAFLGTMVEAAILGVVLVLLR